MKMQAQPLMQEFELKSDPDGEARITVRQATEGDNIARASLFAKTNRIINDETIGTNITLQTEFNQRELRRKEAYLTLGSVVGIYSEDVEGEREEWFQNAQTADGPSVKAAMSENMFVRQWNRLPPEIATEISLRVRDANPTWKPDYEGE